MLEYKTIFIDWYGTLSTSKFWGHFKHEHPEVFNGIQKLLFGKDGEVVMSWQRGKLSSEEVVKLVSEKLCVDYEFLWQEYEKSCRELKFDIPEVAQVIARLRKKGKKVILATDNMDSFCKITIPETGLENIFDDILDSYRHGHIKSDVNDQGENLFFKKYIESNSGISPKEAVLLDDSLNTKESVEKLGLSFVYIPTPDDLTAHLNRL